MQKVLILAGVSGVGKSTLIKILTQEYDFYFGVSHTTRQMRTGETNGRDYHFVSKAYFQILKDEGAFIETMSFADNDYGMSFAEIESPDKDIVLDLDYNGYKILKEKYPEVIGIFLVHTDLKALSDRLCQREKENGTNCNTNARLDLMEQTMQEAKFFDYRIDVTNLAPADIIEQIMTILD